MTRMANLFSYSKVQFLTVSYLHSNNKFFLFLVFNCPKCFGWLLILLDCVIFTETAWRRLSKHSNPHVCGKGPDMMKYNKWTCVYLHHCSFTTRLQEYVLFQTDSLKHKELEEWEGGEFLP